MDIIQILKNEHLFISEGLEFLKVARDKIEKNEQPPKLFFQKAITFFRNYADKHHHYKEEFLMFGFLAQKKEGQMDLAIGSLRHQHDIGQQFLTKLENSLGGYEMNNEIAITSLLGNLVSFTSILKRHIFIEDNLFFPMVEQDLSSDEKSTLLKQFVQEEKTLSKMNPVEKNLELLKAMEKLISIDEK